VTSFFHDGARRRAVSVNHVQQSGVGSAQEAAGSSATTGIVAGGFCYAGAPVVGENLPDLRQMIRTDEAANIVVAADQRNLRDHAFHAPVDSADDQHVAAAVTGPPDADALRIGLVQRLRVGDRVAVVADLLPGIKFLPWFSVTGAEVAIVVDDEASPAFAKASAKRSRYIS
jgi:hypothetical protein